MDRNRLTPALLALSLLGAALAGVGGLLLAVFAAASGEWIVATFACGAAGLTFGLTANALLRQ